MEVEGERGLKAYVIKYGKILISAIRGDNQEQFSLSSIIDIIDWLVEIIFLESR